MRQPFSINTFLYRVEEGSIRFLLLKRVQRSELSLPAFWQGVTGGMEEGETLEETAAREIFEETGYKPNLIEAAGYEYSFPIKDEWRVSYGSGPTEIIEKVYCAKVEGEPQLSDEHSEYKWVSESEAKELMHFDTNKLALEAANKWLSS
ncbi:NUDIX hydrolase [Vibrio nitrifigilis]|uniref:NUDIX pyrophosphatase n=1 Tax=Vibrio nitrifigilis TaxID=2789781 RepID=A0ABS0GLD4_9VIBR|nr:NUDIX pyrophosphatase [Vibrio nitrifigilis]MBF9002963.1 NUDIX pyrophosphatase [Vibrio nitrifigilis]